MSDRRTGKSQYSQKKNIPESRGLPAAMIADGILLLFSVKVLLRRGAKLQCQ
ncbi:hypothetical protein [Mangrovibacterium marinum]|uniref:hypothetical protein n=1 Tax=Mangrovibacterium marinum TaxID=1639118 RepID=UPI002A18853D|nr:hypothetical protein [Mangrovibacterium marinum]